jgi:hypothetical protein
MLPTQKDVESIKQLIKNMKNPEYQKYQSGWLQSTIVDILGLTDESTIKLLNSGYYQNYSKNQEELMLVYSLCRANHQINEAANKIWSTLELAYSVKDRNTRLVKSFSHRFLQGTLIPSLYYSLLSAIVSNLCIYGIVSFRYKKQDLLLARETDSWKLFDRKTYLKEHFSKSSDSWHDQVQIIYEGLVHENYQVPELDKIKMKQLKDHRNKMHYLILSDITMSDEFVGIEPYFEFFPFCLIFIKNSLDLIQSVWTITKGTDERLKELYQSLSKFYQLYEFEVPDTLKNLI